MTDGYKAIETLDNFIKPDATPTNGELVKAISSDWAFDHAADLGAHDIVRAATYVVAASDAPAHVKAQADRVCSGADDDVDIQWALDAAGTDGGGLIQLSSGTFLADKIQITFSNIILRGNGRDATILRYDGAVVEDLSNFLEIGEGVSNVLIEDMTIDAQGNIDYALGTINPGDMIDPTNGPQYVILRNLKVLDGSDDTVVITSYAKHILITNSQIYRNSGKAINPVRGRWSALEIEDSAEYVTVSNSDISNNLTREGGDPAATIITGIALHNDPVSFITTRGNYVTSTEVPLCIDYDTIDYTTLYHENYTDYGSVFDGGEYILRITGGKNIRFIGSTFVLAAASYGVGVEWRTRGDIYFIGCIFDGSASLGATLESLLNIIGDVGDKIENVVIQSCLFDSGRTPVTLQYITGLKVDGIEIRDALTSGAIIVSQSTQVDMSLVLSNTAGHGLQFDGVNTFTADVFAQQIAAGYYAIDAYGSATTNGAICLKMADSTGARGVRFQTAGGGTNVQIIDGHFPDDLAAGFYITDANGFLKVRNNTGYIAPGEVRAASGSLVPTGICTATTVTGTFTESPLALKPGANTMHCTASGTINVVMPAGSTAVVTSVGGGATVTDSPKTCPAGATTLVTVTTGGTNDFIITVHSNAFAWHNPEAQDILIKKIVINRTAAGGTATAEMNVGIGDNGTVDNPGTEFFNNMLVNNAAAIHDSYVAGGTSYGTQTIWVSCEDSVSATGGWIVGKLDTEIANALAGTFYIEYVGK